MQGATNRPFFTSAPAMSFDQMQCQLNAWGFDEETVRNTALNKRNMMLPLVGKDGEHMLDASLHKVGSETETLSCASSSSLSRSVRFKSTVERVRYAPLRIADVTHKPAMSDTTPRGMAGSTNVSTIHWGNSSKSTRSCSRSLGGSSRTRSGTPHWNLPHDFVSVD